jgi:hypothetical protein
VPSKSVLGVSAQQVHTRCESVLCTHVLMRIGCVLGGSAGNNTSRSRLWLRLARPQGNRIVRSQQLERSVKVKPRQTGPVHGVLQRTFRTRGPGKVLLYMK